MVMKTFVGEFHSGGLCVVRMGRVRAVTDLVVGELGIKTVYIHE